MSVCKLAARCHVAGKGISTFGSKFTQAKVLELASSSVLLVDAGAKLDVASGILIAPNVMLCAAHSINSITANFQAQLLFECDAKTAPGTPTSSGSAPPPCTSLTTAPQIVVGKMLENGQSLGLDYALFAISWTQSSVTFPRKVTLPKPDFSYGGELLATGHPVVSHKGEATQASAGVHIGTAQHGPHPVSTSPAEAAAQEYTYATFVTIDGMSGGGVFNEKGSLVGIVTGFRTGAKGVREFAFLNLGLVAGKTVTSGGVTKPASERIKQWMGGGQPSLPSDPQLAPGTTFSPSL